MWAGLYGLHTSPALFNWYFFLLITSIRYFLEFYLTGLLTPFEAHVDRFELWGKSFYDFLGKMLGIAEFWGKWFFFGTLLTNERLKWVSVVGVVISVIALYVP
eukprot:g29856.t1